MSVESTASKNIAKAILFVFAIFGFFGSIATIYEVLSKKESQLVARSYPSTPKIPYFIYSEIGPGFEDNGRAFVNLFDDRCSDGKAKSGVATSGDEKANSADHICKHIKDLKFLSDRVEVGYTLRGTVFDIELDNTGVVTAKNIKIPASSIEFIDVFSKGRKIKIDYDENSGDFLLPNLNPAETYKIQIWKSGIPFNNDDDHFYSPLEITYDGPPIKLEEYKYVNSSDWEYVEMFFDMGPVFGTLMFIFIGFSAGLLIIAAISLVAGLSQGKTIKEIFATPAKVDEKS